MPQRLGRVVLDDPRRGDQMTGDRVRVVLRQGAELVRGPPCRGRPALMSSGQLRLVDVARSAAAVRGVRAGRRAHVPPAAVARGPIRARGAARSAPSSGVRRAARTDRRRRAAPPRRSTRRGRACRPGAADRRSGRPGRSRALLAVRGKSKRGRSRAHSSARPPPFRKEVRRCPTLPRGLPCSTIGAESLSFRVRNVTGRFPLAMAAETLWMFQSCPTMRTTRVSWCVVGSRPSIGNHKVDASSKLFVHSHTHAQP